MKTFSRNVFYALIATILFSACSRPYATYQKMPVEHFGSKASKATPALPVETVMAEVQQDKVPSPSLTDAVDVNQSSATLANAQQAIDQVVASTENKATATKLQKRMARIQSMLASETTQTTKQASVAKKPNLVERLMLKNVDKKIKKTLAPSHPNAPKAVNIVVTIGALVALLGLILWLATTSTGVGVTLLLVGVILLLVGLIV